MYVLLIVFMTGTISPMKFEFKNGGPSKQQATCLMAKKSLDLELKEGPYVYISKCIKVF